MCFSKSKSFPGIQTYICYWKTIEINPVSCLLSLFRVLLHSWFVLFHSCTEYNSILVIFLLRSFFILAPSNVPFLLCSCFVLFPFLLRVLLHSCFILASFFFHSCSVGLFLFYQYSVLFPSWLRFFIRAPFLHRSFPILVFHPCFILIPALLRDLFPSCVICSLSSILLPFLFHLYLFLNVSFSI